MGFLDKAKAAAEQAANRANETVAEVQAKRELSKAYGELGETAYRLADSGALSHPEIAAQVTKIRELRAKVEDAGGDGSATGGTGGAPADPTSAVEQPMAPESGPGAA